MPATGQGLGRARAARAAGPAAGGAPGAADRGPPCAPRGPPRVEPPERRAQV